ncbi:hypothetical protein D3C87_2003000 [compost metagenome]
MCVRSAAKLLGSLLLDLETIDPRCTGPYTQDSTQLEIDQQSWEKDRDVYDEQ